MWLHIPDITSCLVAHCEVQKIIVVKMLINIALNFGNYLKSLKILTSLCVKITFFKNYSYNLLEILNLLKVIVDITFLCLKIYFFE